MKNIIFIVDAPKTPSGGGKVIYQYSNYINSKRNFSSSIIHLEKKRGSKLLESIKKRINLNKTKYFGWDFKDVKIKKNYKFSWIEKQIQTKNNFYFDKDRDFVVLPEIFSHFAPDFLIKEKIPYAIFVQNGYSIFSTNKLAKLKQSYNHAKYILSYSKDIEKCVLLAFPNVKNKILKVGYSIDFKKFKTKKKKNVITYMPRKIPHQSQLVLSFLKNLLPKSWKVKALHNLNQGQVYNELLNSKIFLAFSYLEGLPLPPVEAALAGNRVIGYTGEGGKEYWKKPIFIEIKSTEIKNFCSQILKYLNDKKFLKASRHQRLKLSKQFSVQQEQKFINNFLRKL